MANPEPLPQRATRISMRLRGQEPVLEVPRDLRGQFQPLPTSFFDPGGH